MVLLARAAGLRLLGLFSLFVPAFWFFFRGAWYRLPQGAWVWWWGMGSTEPLVKFMSGSRALGQSDAGPKSQSAPGALSAFPGRVWTEGLAGRAAADCLGAGEGNVCRFWEPRLSWMKLTMPLGSALRLGLKQGQPAAWSTCVETQHPGKQQRKITTLPFAMTLFCADGDSKAVSAGAGEGWIIAVWDASYPRRGCHPFGVSWK